MDSLDPVSLHLLEALFPTFQSKTHGRACEAFYPTIYKWVFQIYPTKQITNFVESFLLSDLKPFFSTNKEINKI